MKIHGNLLTTAMAVMPHKDLNRALELALWVLGNNFFDARDRAGHALVFLPQ